MAYKKKFKSPPFVALTWKMLNSQAYKDLLPSAAKSLPHFWGKVKLRDNDPQKYSIEFPFSYTEAKKLGFALGTHHRVICELTDKGFIDLGVKGGLRGMGKTCSLFRLSRRWVEYGTPHYKKAADWKRLI